MYDILFLRECVVLVRRLELSALSQVRAGCGSSKAGGQVSPQTPLIPKLQAWRKRHRLMWSSRIKTTMLLKQFKSLSVLSPSHKSIHSHSHLLTSYISFHVLLVCMLQSRPGEQLIKEVISHEQKILIGHAISACFHLLSNTFSSNI